MRFLAICSYNGSRFFGSQIQKSTPTTVMGRFEAALRSVGIFSAPIASGRTDSGVHALCQPIAFDAPSYWSDEPKKLLSHLNSKLSPYIKIRRLSVVQDGFHPRYDAKRRVYRYLLKDGEVEPFLADFVTFASGIDFEKIVDAIGVFEGRHNFWMFKKTGSDEKSSVRTIYSAKAYRHRDLIVLRFEADAFLRSQIRLMVGALLELSSGKLSKEMLKEQLDGRRRHTVRIAPPNGLYLAKVYY